MLFRRAAFQEAHLGAWLDYVIVMLSSLHHSLGRGGSLGTVCTDSCGEEKACMIIYRHGNWNMGERNYRNETMGFLVQDPHRTG